MTKQSKKTNVSEYAESPEAGTIRLERILPGPIERVWSYLTESEKRGKWFASGPMELHPGGNLEFYFDNSKLTPFEEQTPDRFKEFDCTKSRGEVIRCEPPHVLAFTWNEKSGDKSEVTFELSTVGEDVIMVVMHRRLANRTEMVSVSGGWHVHIGILIDLLNGQPLKPFWSTFEKLEAEYDRRLPR